MNGGIDLDTDDIRVALVTSSYTPDQDAHTMYSDITNELSTANGYTAGGKQLTTPVITADNTNNLGKFDADDVSWASSSITARRAVLYKNTGTPSTSALIACIDFGADKTTTSGTFLITWNAGGILNLT